MTTEHLKKTIHLISGHEFNTPMNGILGFSTLLSTSGDSFNQEDKKIMYNALLQSAKRLLNLSKRLNIWLMLTEDCTLHHVPYRLTQESIEELFLAEAAIFQKNGDVLFFSSENQAYALVGNKEYLVYAVKELVHNAFKFSTTGSIVSLKMYIKSGSFMITISNNSESVTAADLNKYKIFTQFDRNKHEQQGVGIGLEIARLASQQSGGELIINGIDNENGCLVSMTIKIPVS